MTKQDALAGKHALVTGGGTGIGAAIARDLGAAGVSVVVAGRRQGPLDETVATIEAGGGRARALTADLTDPDDIEALAAALNAQGGVDILINNAGFSSKVRSARFIGADEWRGVMDVNTMGPAMLTRALLPAMIERQGGDVVMISSMARNHCALLAGEAFAAASPSSAEVRNSTFPLGAPAWAQAAATSVTVSRMPWTSE